WRAAHPWLFVDEFHDIDPAQYQFVQLLAPPGTRTVMAVADDQQRIYGWRGATEKVLSRFRLEYRPRLYKLSYNYRSTRSIVQACDLLLQSGNISRHSSTRRREMGWIERWWHDDEAGESEKLVAEIARLCAEEGHSLDDIALLYRYHRTGEELEQALVRARLPLERIQRDPFFQRLEVQEIRRTLQAAVTVADEFLAAALNFPHLVADELTMIQLRRTAEGRGQTLVELMRTIQECEELGPATRRQVHDFLHLIEETLVPVVHEPLPRVNDQLFQVLEHRRSPYAQAEMETLRGFIQFTDVGKLVEPLKRTLVQGDALQLTASHTVDGWCAATLLRLVLRDYFDRPLAIEPVEAPSRQATLRLSCGIEQQGALNVTARDAGSIRYPATLIAWRLASALLVACESGATCDMVVFDLETTGLNPRYHTAVELAAQRLNGLALADAGYDQLVNPGRSIPQSATDVHGIFPQDVRDKPHVHDALPDFVHYLGSAVLVAHNADFDLRFLRKIAEDAGLPPIQNPVVDTLALARRLLPDAPSYKLEELVRYLKLPICGNFHRAMADVRHTVHLFQHLWELHRRDQQLHVLRDYLPLVAVALLAEGNEADENGLLVESASRLLKRSATLPHWTNDLPPTIHSFVEEHLRQLYRRPYTADPEDKQWAELREQWNRYTNQFLRLGGADSLYSFLTYLALIQREPGMVGDNNRLQLMTIHAAKGKEFRTVFLVGLEEGIMPFYRATTAEELAEERRVCYVGMSRAKERLYLLGCAHRAGRPRHPSPFWHALTPMFTEADSTS
ncbi:MAG: exonuclease domain-containing protein, partial [Chloroflexota bacterium]|nr:exonuclease domain-containing protein [Chloroflexota bacterium]